MWRQVCIYLHTIITFFQFDYKRMMVLIWEGDQKSWEGDQLKNINQMYMLIFSYINFGNQISKNKSTSVLKNGG